MYVEGEVPYTNGTSGTNIVYPYMPYGGGYGNNGGFFGGDGIWAILLFALIFNRGWGNGNGGYSGVTFDGASLVNDINTNTNSGFNQLAVTNGIDAIQSALNSAQVERCNSTTEILQAINGMNSNFQQCCCDNRLASADLKYTIAQENCLDRQTISDGVRDILANTTANTQAILDKLCQQEIDAKNDQIATLRTQLNMANLQASQTAQTAQLIADNNNQTTALINRIAPYPQPSFIVGNPYTSYGYGNGYGCGCNSGCTRIQ